LIGAATRESSWQPLWAFLVSKGAKAEQLYANRSLTLRMASSIEAITLRLQPSFVSDRTTHFDVVKP
jgi:hypothetical protein